MNESMQFFSGLTVTFYKVLFKTKTKFHFIIFGRRPLLKSSLNNNHYETLLKITYIDSKL